MNERERKALSVMLEPICDAVKESYRQAIILRCEVSEALAVHNGAEVEDIGPLMATTIEAAQPLTQRWLDEIGMVDRGRKIDKGDFE